MPIIPNFSSSQSLGTPNTITISDISTGSDIAITEKRVFIQKQDGTYLVPSGTLTNYIVWPLAASSISIIVLNADMALNVTVQWVSVVSSVVTILYTKQLLFPYTAYQELFDFGLIADEQSYPTIINNQNWYISRIKLRIAINDAKNAALYGGDIASSQAACDRGMYLVNNKTFFY